MFDIKITGLDELQRELKRIERDMQREVEKTIRIAVNRIVLSAQTNCPDANLREKIVSDIQHTTDGISITISAPEEAKRYLEEAFEENKNTIPKEVSDTIRRAIKK